jgi:hypothetical protein
MNNNEKNEDRIVITYYMTQSKLNKLPMCEEEIEEWREWAERVFVVNARN